MLLEIILIVISISLFLFASFFNFFALKARNENLDIEIKNARNHLKQKGLSDTDVCEIMEEINS